MVSLCVLCTFRPKPVFTAPPGPIKSPWKSPYNDQSIGKAVNSCNWLIARIYHQTFLKLQTLYTVQSTFSVEWADFGIVVLYMRLA